MQVPCTVRDRILQANPGEPLAPELASHASGCPACAEALWLRSLTDDAAGFEVPPAGLMYWRAELRLRNQRLEAAMRPARLTQAALPLVLTALAVATAYYAGQPWVMAAALFFALLSAASLWIMRSARS